MPNINLIAARREEKKRLERIAGQLFIGMGASVGVLLLLGFYLAARHLSLSADLQAAEQRMQKIQPTLDEIARLDKEKKDLMPKVETLESAKLDTMRWRAVFQAIPQCMPPDTWFTQLASQEGEEVKVTVQGLTTSQSQVGQLMTNMQGNLLFEKVDLSFNNLIKGTAQDPVTRVQFEVTTVLRSGKKADSADAGKSEKKTAQADTATPSLAPRTPEVPHG